MKTVLASIAAVALLSTAAVAQPSQAKSGEMSGTTSTSGANGPSSNTTGSMKRDQTVGSDRMAPAKTAPNQSADPGASSNNSNGLGAAGGKQ